MAVAIEVARAAGQESLLSVPVSLPYVDEPILLSVGDRVTIPTEFWNYAADSLNVVTKDDTRLKTTDQPWLSDISDPTITGVVRWLGTLPPISDTQLFAGIQTVSLVNYVKHIICKFLFTQDTPVSTDNHGPSGSYADQPYFTCPEGHGVFLPVEYVVRHSKNIKETPTPAYPMNARPHGIALVMAIEEYLDGTKRKGAKLDTQTVISTFNYLQYIVQPYTKVTSLQMIQLVEEIASMDHTAYDSFVCCISSPGNNDHYVKCSDDKYVNVYELVDKIQQCPTLQGKPKIFIINCNRLESRRASPPVTYKIDFDILIMWATQKGHSSSSNSGTIGCYFVFHLEKVIKLKSKTTDLLSMTNEVSIILSMFPPHISRRTKKYIAQCPEVESRLKSKVYFFYEDELPGKYINVIIIETYIIIFIRLFRFTGQSS